MAEEQKRGPGIGGLGEGIRTGLGILSAFKEAVEETLGEAVSRGDLSADSARRAVRDVADRLQETLGDARERIDWVPRREFDALREEVARLEARVARMEGGGGSLSAGIAITD